MVRLHIAPVIGGVQLEKLTPQNVQSLYIGSKSPFVCDTVHTVLHQAFDQAIKLGEMVRNVCDAVDAPRLPVKEVKPMTPAQVTAFLEAIRGDRLESLYIVAIGTGMRLGELFGLKWEDINFNDGYLSVRRTLQEINGKLDTKEPKSKKGRRRIELSRLVVEALNNQRKQLVREGLASCEWVFPNTRGGNLRRSHFHAQSYEPLLTKAGLPSFKFHDLRHTAATLMLMQGTHPKVVQKRLGHAQISITLDTYSHVLPSMQREAADRFDVFLTSKVAAGA